jgi:hypothetical protein
MVKVLGDIGIGRQIWNVEKKMSVTGIQKVAGTDLRSKGGSLRLHIFD